YRVPPPCVIRFTMSAESVPYFTSTLHPVSCSNGFTHESSVYPAHATKLRCPSPGPIDAGAPPLVPPPALVLVDELLLHAIATSPITAARLSSRTAFVMRSPPRARRSLRRRSAPPPAGCWTGSTPDARLPRAPGAPPWSWSPGSVA